MCGPSSPPATQYCKPAIPQVFINGGAGRPRIDISQIFCLKPKDPFARLGDSLKEIVLPPDVYPPDWEKKDTLQDEIVRQALVQLGTELIREHTTKWTKGSNHGPSERSQLRSAGRTARAKAQEQPARPNSC
jgi:hypothetical protein